jgi:hypothetical protein
MKEVLENPAFSRNLMQAVIYHLITFNSKKSFFGSKRNFGWRARGGCFERLTQGTKMAANKQTNKQTDRQKNDQKSHSVTNI